MNARRRDDIRPDGTPRPSRRPGPPARTTAGEARAYAAETCEARTYRARTYAAKTRGARYGAGLENGSGKR